MNRRKFLYGIVKTFGFVGLLSIGIKPKDAESFMLMTNNSKVESGGGVSEITLRDTTTATQSSGSTIQISVPTVSDDELLILSVTNDDGNAWTTPSGWDLEGSVTAGSSTHAIYSRIASSEPANYTITNGGSSSLVAVMTSWQKPSGTWTTDYASASRAAQSIVVSPTMTAVDDCVMYYVFPNDAAYTIIDGPDIGSGIGTPATEAVSIGRVAVSTISMDAYYEPADAGSEIRTVQFSASEDSAVGTVVISY